MILFKRVDALKNLRASLSKDKTVTLKKMDNLESYLHYSEYADLSTGMTNLQKRDGKNSGGVEENKDLDKSISLTTPGKFSIDRLSPL